MELSDHDCSGHFGAPSVHQTLDEMEFERGIWAAALNGVPTNLYHSIAFTFTTTDVNFWSLKTQSFDGAIAHIDRLTREHVMKVTASLPTTVVCRICYENILKHYASRNGHMDAVRALVEARADVNAVTKSGGATPLHRSAYMGHTDILRYLLSRGAAPVSRDADGMTPLHKAAERGRVDCVKLLLENAPTANAICDNRGRKPSQCTTDGKVKDLLT